MSLNSQQRTLVVLGILIAIFSKRILATASYTLAVGQSSNIVGPIEIPINAPMEFNFKSKAEVLGLRKRFLDRTPLLVRGDYVPSAIVFDHIENNRPWWGMHGAFIWGAGKRSIEGNAEESRFLANPFLLVGANSGSALIWKHATITQADLTSSSFPFCWLPVSLRWYPTQSLVQVTYDITDFNRRLAARQTKLILPTVKINQFGLIAYNARDFGFNYIYLDINKSINIINSVQVSEPVLISQMIHCGESSQYPAGCNNMSPAIAEIDRIAFIRLPARARILLWKEKPTNVKTVADMTCFIDFH